MSFDAAHFKHRGGGGGSGGGGGGGDGEATSLPSSPARLPGGGAPGSSRYIISHSGPMGSAGQQSTAAAYFTRVRSRQASNAIVVSSSTKMDEEEETLSYNFSSILSKCPPPVPPALLKRMGDDNDGSKNNLLKVPPSSSSSSSSSMGKVRVILRVATSKLTEEKKKGQQHFVMDKKRRQVTLLDPSSSSCNSNNKEVVSAPKMFAFDGLFTDEDPQSEVAASALSDAIHAAVVHGADGCVFSFGHAALGKTRTMVGADATPREAGIIPTAVTWTFQCVAERKEKSNARFAVRASAMEIAGGGSGGGGGLGGRGGEEVKDLLAHLREEGAAPPSALFAKAGGGGGGGGVMQNLTEVRCPTVERAAHYLDVALSRRGRSEREGRDSHLVFTLHLYQYSVDSSKKRQQQQDGGEQGEEEVSSRVIEGGRSRLHLIDFGCCERVRTGGGGGSITLSALGHVLLGIFNGQRHLPCRESPVTLLLRECLLVGSPACQAAMLAHVSPAPANYSEALHTAQLASRIHRMRRRRGGRGSGSSGGGSGSGSSDENKRGGFKETEATTTSTDPSSSEQSCDTVIYVGRNGGDDDDTDAEHPPVYLPNLNSGDNRGMMATALRGSTVERDRTGTRTLERRRSAGSSGMRQHHRSPLSDNPNKRMPVAGGGVGGGGKRSRPGSVGSTPTRGMFGVLNSPRQHQGGGVLFHPRRMQQYQHGSYYGSLGRGGGGGGGGGSLPRSPKGKMPLHGRVAGYRQAPSNGGFSSGGEEEWWIDRPQVLQAAAAAAARSGGGGGGFVVRQRRGHQPLSTRHSDSGDSGAAAYGFMDDHKRGMIQQWVECQAAELAVQRRRAQETKAKKMVPVQAPPEMSNEKKEEVEGEKPEPFAWLKEGGEAALENGNPDCKVLTHFRTVETSSSESDGEKENGKEGKEGNSSTAATTTTVSADVHVHNTDDDGNDGGAEEDDDNGVSVPPSPAVSSIFPEETAPSKAGEEVLSNPGKNTRRHQLQHPQPSPSSRHHGGGKSNGHCKVVSPSSSPMSDGKKKSLSSGGGSGGGGGGGGGGGEFDEIC